MSKNLIRGFLLAHNAPKEIMVAFEMATKRSTAVVQKESYDAKKVSIDKLLQDNVLSVRTKNCVQQLARDISKNMDFNTVEHLLELSESALFARPNFGRKSLNELVELLEPHKFSNPSKISYDYQNNKYVRLT